MDYENLSMKSPKCLKAVRLHEKLNLLNNFQMAMMAFLKPSHGAPRMTTDFPLYGGEIKILSEIMYGHPAPQP